MSSLFDGKESGKALFAWFIAVVAIFFVSFAGIFILEGKRAPVTGVSNEENHPKEVSDSVVTYNPSDKIMGLPDATFGGIKQCEEGLSLLFHNEDSDYYYTMTNFKAKTITLAGKKYKILKVNEADGTITMQYVNKKDKE